jgi:IS1 family transposase
MPSNFTTNSWLFPPKTREVQFDEKWSFVGKKEKHCDRDDPADDEQGDCWDYVALDPEHRLVVSVVIGRHSGEHVQLLVDNFHRRTEGRLMNLMTSDENPAYAQAILERYGQTVRPRRKGKRGRQPAPRKKPPQGLKYATVHKTREKNRVVAVDRRVIYGTVTAVVAALAASAVSDAVNTVFVERHNGTDRNRNARKVRKTYCFSKDWQVHEAVTYFTLYSYNFCWPVRTLRQGSRRKGYRQRTPAMAAGLTDHVWSLKEWLSFPGAQRR